MCLFTALRCFSGCLVGKHGFRKGHLIACENNRTQQPRNAGPHRIFHYAKGEAVYQCYVKCFHPGRLPVADKIAALGERQPSLSRRQSPHIELTAKNKIKNIYVRKESKEKPQSYRSSEWVKCKTCAEGLVAENMCSYDWLSVWRRYKYSQNNDIMKEIKYSLILNSY